MKQKTLKVDANIWWVIVTRPWLQGSSRNGCDPYCTMKTLTYSHSDFDLSDHSYMMKTWP